MRFENDPYLTQADDVEQETATSLGCEAKSDRLLALPFTHKLTLH